MSAEIFYVKKAHKKPNVQCRFRVVRWVDYEKVRKENELLQLKIEVLMEQRKEQEK